MDPFYQQQPYGNDFRQLLNRLTEKVDLLNEKVFLFFQYKILEKK